MRVILFRGKRVDNGEWVYGDLLNVGVDYDYAIRTYGGREHGQVNAVNEKTVGQYTGLTIPSGKIFEHDIVTAKFKSNGARFNFTVKYNTETGGFVFDNGCIKVSFTDIRSVRIIGNIHDNPELLKGGEE